MKSKDAIKKFCKSCHIGVDGEDMDCNLIYPNGEKKPCPLSHSNSITAIKKHCSHCMGGSHIDCAEGDECILHQFGRSKSDPTMKHPKQPLKPIISQGVLDLKIENTSK